jgi:hypothetical protein
VARAIFKASKAAAVAGVQLKASLSNWVSGAVMSPYDRMNLR